MIRNRRGSQISFGDPSNRATGVDRPRLYAALRRVSNRGQTTFVRARATGDRPRLSRREWVWLRPKGGLSPIWSHLVFQPQLPGDSLVLVLRRVRQQYPL